MNILINTPLLTSKAIRTSFDNKIMVLFLGLIFTMVILGLIFIDVTKAFSNSALEDQDHNSPTQETIFV